MDVSDNYYKDVYPNSWPMDFYYVGEEVDYDCSICGWSEAKIIEVQPDRVVLLHNGDEFVLYEEDYLRIDDKEYFGH